MSELRKIVITLSLMFSIKYRLRQSFNGMFIISLVIPLTGGMNTRPLPGHGFFFKKVSADYKMEHVYVPFEHGKYNMHICVCVYV